jgi:hypothetical protein
MTRQCMAMSRLNIYCGKSKAVETHRELPTAGHGRALAVVANRVWPVKDNTAYSWTDVIGKTFQVFLEFFS